jgi:hypothetical protein
MGEFYSQMRNEKVELYVGQDGNPTMDYPHVHVVHRGGGQVDVVASANGEHHPWRTTLDHPNGNQVDDAVKAAWKVLSPYRISLKHSKSNEIFGYVELIHVTEDHSRVLVGSIVVDDKPRQVIVRSTDRNDASSTYREAEFTVGDVVEKTTYHSYSYWVRFQ